MTRTGGCICGAIRYTLSEEPVTVRLCWCRDCQYWAGGNAPLNLRMRRSAVQVEGTPRSWASQADSGNHMLRSFCGECGTQMFSQSLEHPEFMVVRAGTLDDASGIRPLATIWTDSAPAWAAIDPAIPSFPRQPG